MFLKGEQRTKHVRANNAYRIPIYIHSVPIHFVTAYLDAPTGRSLSLNWKRRLFKVCQVKTACGREASFRRELGFGSHFGPIWKPMETYFGIPLRGANPPSLALAS